MLARNTTFTYRDKPIDVPELGRKLNANYVIAGSIRHVGNQIRVRAQLIDTVDGYHAWSQKYERNATATDLLSIQVDLAEKISISLGGWSGGIALAEVQRSRSKPVSELSDYECMVQAFTAINAGFEDESTHVRSRACLETLVQREPNFAEARTLLAAVRADKPWLTSGLDPSEADDFKKQIDLVGLAQRTIGLSF